jgi:beta-lactamase regulating signal transducer with metallopeptidase domain
MDRLLEVGFVDGLAGAVVRATILLIIAWVVTLGLRRSSAAIRHCVWALALLGLIALPIVMGIAPQWRIPVLTASAPQPNLAPPSFVAPTAPADVAPSSRIAVQRATAVADAPRVSAAPRRSPTVANAELTVTTARLPVAASSGTWPAPRWNASDVVRVVWVTGFVLALIPTLVALVAGEVRRRRARLVTLDRWDETLSAVCNQYGIRRHVELRCGAGSPIPLTWGIARPVILIPEESKDWSDSTRRLVLMHELAHVSRFDVAWSIIGRVAVSLFWFHPLAWHALRRLRDECERACDDRVVAAGERPTDYAQLLLELARTLRMPRLAVAVPMARTNLLEGRMLAMFDNKLSHAPLGRPLVPLFAAVASIAIFGIAAVRPSRAEAEPQEKAASQPAAGKGRISGVAIRESDKKPSAGADIILLLPPPKGQDAYYGKLPLRKVVADDKGAFSFEGLAPGRYRVWANSGNLTSRRQQLDRGGASLVVAENGENPKPVELKLFAAPTVSVRIVDKSTKRPIAGARAQTGWSDFPDDFVSDTQGVARVRPLTRERYLLEVRADGYAKVTRWVNLESGADAEEDFALEPGVSLEGVVRDSKGKPLAKAGLSIRRKGEVDQHDYVETGADGRYQFTHLPRSAMLELGTSKDDYLPNGVDLVFREPANKLDITLESMPDGGSIVGIVNDHEGRPVVGASVTNQGRSSNLVRETKTGTDGKFRLDNLHQGSTGVDILVRAKGQSPKRMNVEPGTRDKPTEYTVDLAAGHKIKGRVVDEKGKPIAGVSVDFANGRNPFSDGGRMDTDAQGRFAFDALPPNCPFGFSKAGFSEISKKQLELDGNEEVVVEMVSAGVVLGRVVDGKSGKPIKKFVVQLTFSPDRQPGDVSSGLLYSLTNPGQSFQSTDGRFRLNDLVVGLALQVTVLADGYEKGVVTRVLVAQPDSAEVEEVRLEPIDPATLQTVRVRMVDAQGKPITGAQLRLIVAGPRDVGERHQFPFNWTMITTGQIGQQGRIKRFLTGTSDAKGEFAFENVPKDLEMELVWWGKGVVPGRADHLENMDQEAGKPFEITTPAGARIVGTIDRTKYPGAVRIGVSGQFGAIDFDDQEMKPGKMEYEFNNLPPGTYTVSLSSPYERVPGMDDGLTSRVLASGKITLDPGEEGRVEFKD